MERLTKMLDDQFLSTPSVWRATLPVGFKERYTEISIHALRVEGDKDLKPRLSQEIISIHALRVEGDRVRNWVFVMYPISIHALRVEGDGKSAQKTTALLHHNIQNLLLPAIYPAGAARK